MNKFTCASFPLVRNPSEDKDMNEKDSEQIGMTGIKTGCGLTCDYSNHYFDTIRL